MGENNKNIKKIQFLGFVEFWAVAVFIGIGRFP